MTPRVESMDFGHLHWSVRYGAAAVFTGLALLLNLLPPAQSLPFLFFFAAVTLSARICGFGAALFATFLSAVVADFFLLTPRFSFAHGRADLLRLLFFGLVSLLISSIAKQKSEAEKVADERRGQLAAVVESSDDAIFNKSLDGTILAWNRGAEQMYAYRPNEVIGKNVRMLAPPDRAEEVSAILERLRRGERIAHFETKRVTKDGRLLDVSLSISPVFDEQGKIVEAATIARDVTERKQAEAELIERENKLRLFVEHAPAAMAMFDRGMRYVAVSDRWLRDYDLSLDIIGRSHYEVFPDIPEPWTDVHRRCLAGAVEKSEEDRFERADGSITWLKWEVRPWFDSTGEIGGIVIFSEDISERKKVEDRLRKTEKLAAVGQLGATIAHELNNPLEAVTNLAYLMRKNKSLDEKARKQLELLNQELNRMADMTRRTLGFYRDTSSAVPVALGQLMDGVLTLYAHKIESKSIDLQREYEAHGEIAAFPGEMRKVFSNLIANAIDAVPNRGRITVRIRNASDWRDSAVGGVRVAVADSGSGIALADRKKIFEPFYTTKKDTGTGLGLWLSKDIVQKHGGSISVRGKSNGTVFSVFIPAKSSPVHEGLRGT